MMKKIFVIVLAVCVTKVALAQEPVISDSLSPEPSVARSLWGVQIGLPSLWVTHEWGISKHVALRTEVGFGANPFLTALSLIPNFGSFLIQLQPMVTSELRWYYFLEKNSPNWLPNANNGNFIALHVNFQFPLGTIILNLHSLGSVVGVSLPTFFFSPPFSVLNIIPKWGIKRTLLNGFTYELGIGAGLLIFWNTWVYPSTTNFIPTIDVHLRIGFSF